MNEQKEIKSLYEILLASKRFPFTNKGKRVNVSNEQGVYIIYNPVGVVLHVGRTAGALASLNQRLNNHRTRTSSFRKSYLKPNKINLNSDYKFQYLEVEGITAGNFHIL